MTLRSMVAGRVAEEGALRPLVPRRTAVERPGGWGEVALFGAGAVHRVELSSRSRTCCCSISPPRARAPSLARG